MASGKRASMREGPLADLFRRTDAAAEEAEAAARAGQETAAPAAKPQDPRALRAAQQQQRLTDVPEPEPERPRAGIAMPQPTTAAGERAARERDYPHPSFGADEAPPEEPSRPVPSPQERLRHAFSSELPEEILERPAP